MSSKMTVVSPVVDAEPVFTIDVPLAMVAPLHAVASDMGSDEDWIAVGTWAQKVGVENVSTALSVLSGTVGVRTSAQRWRELLTMSYADLAGSLAEFRVTRRRR